MKSEIKIFSPFRLLLYATLAILLVPQVRRLAESTKPGYMGYLIILSFLLCYILVPFMLAIGHRFNILDHPDNERKHHENPTPLTGGVAIFVAFALTILLNFHFSTEMKAVLVASTLIFITGFIDDHIGLSAKIRLLVQVIASLILVYFGVRVTFVPPYLGGIYVETAITLIWLIGITNSMNFIDGMDGLASGTSIIYSVFFAIIAFISHQTYMMFLALAIAGSCLGFFPFNFRKNRPALVFMGDSGSTFLGFLLASFAILGEWGDSILDIAVPILIMSVLIFDMTLTTIIRIHSREVKSFGQWIHYTGRDHFHHRLTSVGLNRFAATLVLFLVSICFGIEAVVLLFSDVWISIVILIHSIIAFFIIGIILVVKK